MNPLRFLVFLWQVVAVVGLASGGHLSSKGASSSGSHKRTASGGHPFAGGAYSYGEACILGGKNYFLTGASGPKPFAGRGWSEKVGKQQPSVSAPPSDNADADPSTSFEMNHQNPRQ